MHMIMKCCACMHTHVVMYMYNYVSVILDCHIMGSLVTDCGYCHGWMILNMYGGISFCLITCACIIYMHSDSCSPTAPAFVFSMYGLQ